MPGPTLLKLENIAVAYGGIQALNGLNLEVRSGEIVTLIGANGAGKTSCLRAISGMLRPQQGRVSFAGQDITGEKPHILVRKALVHVPEGRMMLNQQSVEDNLLLGAWTRQDKTEIVESLQEIFAWFPRLKERRLQMAASLSGGEQQMLAMARALMSKPKLLLLDEPSLGLAPLIVQEIFTYIQKLNSQGMALLLVEQNARMALRIAHRAYVLESGRLAFEGQAAELLHDTRVQKAYLGV